jgi:tRNA nucleotidyltransferase (CCA-adding enzyme)
MAEWRHISPSITGHELRALGLPPGPVYKRILKRLRDEWLDGNVSTLQEEKQLLKKLTREEMEDHSGG